MSTLLKKPFIEEVVDGLDDASISSFQRFLDMGDGYSTSYQLRDGKLPTGANPSVERCTLLIDGPAQLCGVYAKYKKGNEEHSAMVSFTTLESCTMYEIDEGRLTCRRIRERLSASELRRVLRERDIAKTENGSVIYNDGLEVKSNGDVAIGKNLEVDGTSKFNGGFKPIHTYEFSDQDNDYILEVWFEYVYQGNEYGFIGKFFEGGKEGIPYIISGDYLMTTPGVIDYLTGYVVFAYANKSLGYVHYDGPEAPNLQKGRFALDNEAQPKLFRHTLTLTASDKTYILVYDSTSNLNADSVADLRTIMKISSSHESEVLPLCSSDMTSTACLKVTASVCQIGTNNVTAVADVVDLK